VDTGAEVKAAEWLRRSGLHEHIPRKFRAKVTSIMARARREGHLCAKIARDLRDMCATIFSHLYAVYLFKLRKSCANVVLAPC
jgi:hypothetical protein